MATRSDAQVVKSLNKSSGRRRFVFKKFCQRIAEIDIDVYRSLEPLNAEPSTGSSFFRDCLVQWRELNTADDFISFYEEMFPLVQTLPQILLQKESILSKLLSRLRMKSRLSLEPILRLIAALSRDLLEDFLPFLKRIVSSLVFLLKTGADREPEIMEQIFTSWSYIMMYLQKYLTKDVVHVLKVTSRLRYYPKDYVQEFMAESVSFILRNAPIMQLVKGIRKVLIEVAKRSSVVRKSGVSELFWYVVRGTSSRLHSRAQQALQLLMDKSVFCIRGQLIEGSDSVLEVLNSVFHRLSMELEPAELKLVWDGLFAEIRDSVTSDDTVQLNRLLSLLLSTMQNGYVKKMSDYQQMIQLVMLLLETYVTPCTWEAEKQSTELTDKILHLLLCILDGLCGASDMSTLSHISVQWAPVFNLKNTSLLTFLKDLLLKDVCILRVFLLNIISALNDLIEISEEDVIYLLLIFCEKLEMSTCGFLNGIPKEKLSRICSFAQQSFSYWVGMINNAVHGNLASLEFLENRSRFALLWGTIRCYPYLFDGQEGLSPLMNLLNALEDLLMIESGFPKDIWQSLIGATLDSYKKVLYRDGSGNDDSAVSQFLYIAKKYHSSSQILSAVADMLDSLFGSVIEAQNSRKTYHPELKAVNLVDVLKTFAENLCHSDRLLRLSTLRILCHYEPLKLESSSQEQSNEKNVGDGVSQTFHMDDRGANVLELLLLIEATPLSVDTSRKVILLLSKIQMMVSATRIAEDYIPALFYGIIGIFHKRFSYLWSPAMECLAVLIKVHFEILWDKYVQYLDHCDYKFPISQDQSGRSGAVLLDKPSDLVGHFNSFVTPTSDSTPCTTVFSLIIQTLQKVPCVEYRSRDIMPLFLKFLGYCVNDLMSVELYDLRDCNRKEWKGALKEWLNLFRLMRNPKSFYQGQFFKDVLQYRLLDDNDAEVQIKVLDCLLNWKDDFLLPYAEHLRNLINAKNLREELTTWSLSRESNLIDEQHRSDIVPTVIRILVPKVRKLKTLASRKRASIYHRRAILGFLAHLDIDELPLFFSLLIKPLQTVSQGAGAANKLLWSSSDFLRDGFHSLILQQFTIDGIKALSWKKRYGFLHVTEEVLEVFDEWHISPFLDLLMGCIVRILESCTTTLETESTALTNSGSNMSAAEHDDEMETEIMSSTSVKQFKEMRSLCLKIISSALGKYESHDFDCEFWDRFFAALKPLIAGFKQEGASSEKPSSLFSCFLAMSRSLKFVSLLSREKHLVPDIFSMLTISSASDAILSCVFKFVENLLSLDSDLGDDDSSVKIVLLPHLDVLVCSLRMLFTHDNATKRKVVRYPGEKELTVFKLLSKYIKEPLAARKFVDILLPLLARRSQKNFDSCVDILQIIQHVVNVVGSGNSEKIVSSVSPLLTFAELEVRVAVCDVLNALSESDSSVLIVAKLLSELNATSAMEIGGLDYDTVIGAYEKINKDLFYALQKEHVLILLSHAVHDMSSEEMILRQSAYGMLVCFFEFAGEIIDEKEVSNHGCWSEAGVKQIVSNFILKHMGNAMSKGTSVQKVWIDLLRGMTLKLPKMANLDSYGALYSQDPEQDFFSNIIHLQKHRRARALSRFSHAISSGNLSQVITNRIFIPLFFNMLFDLQHGKGENVRSACLEAIASISGCMSWKQYYPLLNRCFREMTLKPEKQKVLLRLISSILDHFHFSGAQLNEKADDSEEKDTDISADGFTDIQICLQKTILPKIQKLLTSDSDNVNVNTSLVALKLLKLLPGETMNLQLPSIIHRISNFLKNRLVSVRDEARSALASCLKELGLEYLQFIVKVLTGTLKRGYELHVLGYTLNFLLSKFPMNLINGKLDYCLDDLLSVIDNDIFGDVSEQKEEEKFASKMKETRKQKSFETVKLIAQSITFRTHALKLLSPVTVHLQKQLTPKLKSKLETMLNHIAVGIESNPSVNMTELFIFAYRLIKDGIDDGACEQENAYISRTGKQDMNEMDTGTNNSDKLIEVDTRYSHFISGFALGLLQNYMKNLKLSQKNEELLSLLDPFVGLLCKCLRSKYENIVSTALRCLSPLVKLPLPSLESEADKIKNSLFIIAQGSWNTGNPMMESCLRLLTVLLRSTRITLSADQLHMLIQFPLFVDIERNPSFVALSLLKAVVNRKLVVPEIYDIINRVAELMVRSQAEPVRKKCSQILLQFLLDYHLSEKRLQQHIDFLLANLRYEHSSGREAVLEMLHAIIMKFPASVVDGQSQTLFVHLVVCLANDPDNKVRSMTGAVIKLLIGRVAPHSLQSIIEYSLSWYLGEKQHLWSAAAQVLGLLVEVTKNGFHTHVNSVLPVMRKILQSGVNVLMNSHVDVSHEGAIYLWKEAYYSLVMLEKTLHQFAKLCYEKDLEEIWEIICQLLVHPHSWLRNISNRLVALYFAHVTESCRERLFLMRTARLFLIAASLCCQLKTQPTDETAVTLIEQNLVFAICHLHSHLGQNEYMDFPKFWFDLEDNEKGHFLKAFELLDSRKGRSTVAYLTSDLHGQCADLKSDRNETFLISYLLKKMGKISLEMEIIQMRSIFNCFKSISPKLLDQNKSTTPLMEVDVQNCAYQMLFPLYKVSEGYAGKAISDDDKLFAQGIRDSIRDSMGILKYVEVCHQIEKNLKVKRDKRKQEEKLMAVINPTRNAKRKLRIGAKHRANKKRKIMTLKMVRWM